MIDSVYRTGKNYYLQVFLEEWKYAIKKKMPEYITDDILPDDSDRKNSDEENFNEEKYRMHLLFIFLMSQMIYPYILLKNVVISKVTHVILGDLKSF